MARCIEYGSMGMIVSALAAVALLLVLATPGAAAADDPGPKTLCNTVAVQGNEVDPDPADNSTALCSNINAPEFPKTLCNTAVVTGNEDDPDLASNSATECSTVAPPALPATVCNTVAVVGNKLDPNPTDNTTSVCSLIHPIQPDVNGDGKVNVKDLLIVAGAMGSQPPSPPGADVNGDGVVDVVDLTLVAMNFGP